jgi:hypothetical protein
MTLLNIILMALHGISKITVLKLDPKKTPLEQAADLTRQSTTGNVLLPNMPFNDTVAHGQATQILKVFNNFKAKPPTATKGDLQIELDKGEAIYNPNAGYIEAQARLAATTTGNLNSGINLAQESGYYLKSTKSPVSSSFTGEPEGNGSVRIDTKAVAQRAGYIRAYGYTTAKGVPPQTIKEYIFSLEAEVHIAKIPAATIVAVKEATITPISRQANDSEPQTELDKTITPKIITKAHKRIYSDTDVTHYKWSDWIYIVVT